MTRMNNNRWKQVTHLDDEKTKCLPFQKKTNHVQDFLITTMNFHSKSRQLNFPTR